MARAHRLEGVVAKRRSSRYEPGRRSTAWVKTALLTTREVLVGGWTAGEGRRLGTSARCCSAPATTTAGCGTWATSAPGSPSRCCGICWRRLEPLRQDASPFDEPVPREHARGARWVTPELVGEVQYRTLTSERRLRHAAWRGLRPDRDPDEVRLEPA